MRDDPVWADVGEVMRRGTGPAMARLRPLLGEGEEALTRFEAFNNRLNQLHSIRDIELHDEQITGEDKTSSSGATAAAKSNAIDGLQVFSKLSQGHDVREAIEGSRGEGAEVRGGVRGCAPFGEQSFALGCCVSVGDERFGLDVTVAVDPESR